MAILRQFARVLLGATVLAAPVGAQSAARTSEISGVVKLKDGSPLASGLVTAQQVVTRAQTESASGASVLTGKDGSFRLTGLPGGSYRLCIFSPKDEVLDPCEWSAPPPLVQVAAGGAASGVSLVAARGVTLKIRIDDFSSAAPTRQKPRNDAYLQPGVRSADGAVHNCRLVASDRVGHSYEVVVPPGADLQFHADAYNLQVSDQFGAAVSSSHPGPIRADAATVAAGLHYQVTPAHQGSN
jgi:hypothetical protein